MKDLFERLKAESPVNKLIKGHRKSTEVPEKKRAGVLSPRRDSMPPPCSPIIFKAVKANKGRSLSPPKSRRLSLTKPFKVLIERKKLDQLLNNAVPMKNAPQKINVEIKKLSTPPASRTTRNNKEPKSSSTQQTQISPKKTSNLQSLESNSPMEVVFKEPKKISTPQKKSTSNKAQQKQCVTASTEKALQHPTPKQQQPKLKRCLVRVRRENLHKLQSSSTESRSVDNQIPVKSPNVSPKPKRNLKRKSSETPEKVSPRKRGRPSKIFIKLSTSKTELNDQGEKETKKNKKDTPRTPNKPNKINSPSTQVIESTKPTNLSRTNLMAAFGKRFFKSHVKIEKCTHPLMLIFESNARARKEQANHSKCKNLSVSFRDQVEIFGSSDEESGNDEDAYQSETSLFPTASFSGALNAKSGDISLPVMPARLKKIENGKVVDDIVLDPALFLNPEDVADCAAISSTPYPPGHKKREKILFSPLKGDATPSLRKEQFKLANEKIPASVLRHVNIDDMDDDDDDEDCEYIVPTEIPERRGSRTNSSNAADSSCSFVSAIDSPVGNSEIKSVTSEEVSTAPLKIDSEVTLANEVRDIKEQNNEASGVESELITRIQVSPSPTHSAHSSLSDGLSAKLKSITSPMTSPVSQSEIPGEASEIPGAISPTHNTLSALLGDVSPIPGALSPTDGTLSPAPGAKSPIDGAMSPTDGAMSPTDGAMSPTDGAMSPTDGALLATDGDFSAIHCMLPSTDNALTSTPGASSPTPGASSPTPGASSPTPGASSPTPGASSPTPGASSPAPAPSSPTPGASSPTPGALSPTPGTSSPTHEPQASSPVPGASSATTGVLSPEPGASSPAPETLPKLKTKTVTVCIDENSMDAEETTPKSSPKNNLDVPQEGSDVTEKSKPHCEPDIALDLFVDVDPEENVSKGLSLFPDSEEDQDILDCLLKERIDEIAKDDDVTNTSVGEAVADDSSKPDELEHILSSANTDIDAD